MSTRERWIVYPLLFLGLATSVYDKIVPPRELRAHSIRCNALVTAELEASKMRCDDLVAREVGCYALDIQDRDSQDRCLRLDAMPEHGGGRLLAYDAAGAPVAFLGATGEAGQGALQMFGHDGITKASVESSVHGGKVLLRDRPGTTIMELGFSEDHAGLNVVDLGKQILYQAVMRAARFQTTEPGESQAPAQPDPTSPDATSPDPTREDPAEKAEPPSEDAEAIRQEQSGVDSTVDRLP